MSQRLSILVSLKVVLPDQAFHELNLKPNTYLSLNLKEPPSLHSSDASLVSIHGAVFPRFRLILPYRTHDPYPKREGNVSWDFLKAA